MARLKAPLTHGLRGQHSRRRVGVPGSAAVGAPGPLPPQAIGVVAPRTMRPPTTAARRPPCNSPRLLLLRIMALGGTRLPLQIPFNRCEMLVARIEVARVKSERRPVASSRGPRVLEPRGQIVKQSLVEVLTRFDASLLASAMHACSAQAARMPRVSGGKFPRVPSHVPVAESYRAVANCDWRDTYRLMVVLEKGHALKSALPWFHPILRRLRCAESSSWTNRIRPAFCLLRRENRCEKAWLGTKRRREDARTR